MTIEELGKMVKSKYPQYSNLSDVDVGNLVLKKYPQYQKQITSETPTTSQSSSDVPDAFLASQPKALRGIGQFLGIEGLARGITQGIQMKTPAISNLAGSIGSTDALYSQLLQKAAQMKPGKERDDLVKKARELQEGSTKYEDIVNLLGKPVTNKEILGSTIQTGTNIVTAGLPAAKTWQQAALLAGAPSAAASFGAGLEEDKDVKSAAIGAIPSGIVGAGLGTLGYAVTKAVQKATKDLPEKIYNNAIGVTKKINEADKSPAPELIKKGWYGPLNDIYEKSNKGIEAANNVIQTELSNSGIKLKTKDVIKEITENAMEKYGDNYSRQEIQQAIKKVPIQKLFKSDTITLEEFNKLRSSLDRIIGDTAWLKDNPKLNQDISKTVANIMRNKVQTLAPSTQEAFREMSKLITARDIIHDTVAKNASKMGVSFGDLITGGVFGLSTQRVLPAIGAVTAKRAIESPTTKTALAVGLSRYGNLLDRIPSKLKESAGKLGRTALVNLLKKLGQ